MPPPSLARAAAALVGRATCLAAQVAAPAVPLFAVGAGQELAAAVGSGLLAGLGSIGISLGLQERAERKEQRVADLESLLENGDVARLLEGALRRALEAARGTEGFLAHDEALGRLAEASDGLWLELAASARGELAESFRVPNLLALELEGWGEDGALVEDDWGVLIDVLAARADVDATDWRDRLRRHLAANWPELVKELLKRDFGGGGPTEGRAFADLWLQVEGQRRKDLGELVQTLRGAHADLAERVGKGEQRLAQRLERRLRGVRVRLLLDDERRRAWLTSVDAQLGDLVQRLVDQARATARLSEDLSAIHSVGVQDLAGFERAFWARTGLRANLGPLLEDPAIADRVKAPAAGREPELARFGDFLSERRARVLYWKAEPGVGKSRLCLALGERARELGWAPLFLTENRGDPLTPILARLQQGAGDPAGARVLVVWDTSSGGIDDALAQQVTGLPTNTELLAAGVEAKVVVTSWPVHARAISERMKSTSWFEERELPGLAGSEAFREYLASLLPSGAAAEALLERAEGNALAALVAVALVREGRPIGALPSADELLEERYQQLVCDLVAGREGQDLAVRLAALRGMAAIGRLPKGGILRLDGVDPQLLGTELETLRLAEILAPDEQEALVLAPDRFRIFISRHSCIGPAPLQLAAGVSDWVRLTRPLLEDHLDDVWSITSAALQHRDPVRWRDASAALLAGAAQVKTLDAASALHLARRFLAATAVEEDPDRRRELADRIEALLGVHATAEIALHLATALYNATAGEPDPARREQLADRIEALMARDAAYATAEIARALAGALRNATVGAGIAKCEELAERIEELMERNAAYATPEIAHELARALYSGTADAEPPKCEELAGRIEALMSRGATFATPEIAFALAEASYNATVGAGPATRERMAERIEGLMERDAAYATPEIALALAEALGNATSVAEPAKREEFAGRIEELMERDAAYATPEIALALAEALGNATSVAEPAKREEFAGRIEELMERDAAHATPEIAHELAKALFNATVGEREAAKREQLADRIEALMGSNAGFATAEIALQFARALHNATLVEPDPAKREQLADRIEALMARDAGFATAEIALHVAMALRNATVVEPEPAKREQLTDRIEALMGRDAGFATAEIALLLATALFNAAAREREPAKCERLADRIEALVARDAGFATPGIALQLARARLEALGSRDTQATAALLEIWRRAGEDEGVRTQGRAWLRKVEAGALPPAYARLAKAALEELERVYGPE